MAPAASFWGGAGADTFNFTQGISNASGTAYFWNADAGTDSINPTGAGVVKTGVAWCYQERRSRDQLPQSLTPLVQLLQPPASSPLLVLPTWLPSATQERLLYSFPLMAAPTSASTELLVLLLRSPIHLETRREQSHSVLRALSQPSADHPYRFSSAKVTNPSEEGVFFMHYFWPIICGYLI